MNKKFLCLLCLLLSPLAFACGPWLPTSYVLRNDDVFYSPPEVGFEAELKHLLPASVPHHAVLDGETAGGPSTVQTLSEILKADGLDSASLDTVLAEFEQIRQALNEAKRYVDRPPYPYRRLSAEDGARRAKLDALSALKIPDLLPEEFRLYLKGAIAYYQRDISKARSFWEAVLKLPDSERHHRAVMAAFMLAKTEPRFSPQCYLRVRELVEEGYADRLGLAAASYGLEAKEYLLSARYQKAIDLYLKQWASGYSNAIESL
ncbi:MAG: hypothetical protein ACPGSB_11005, partial [Opitutales bacterium]